MGLGWDGMGWDGMAWDEMGEDGTEWCMVWYECAVLCCAVLCCAVLFVCRVEGMVLCSVVWYGAVCPVVDCACFDWSPRLSCWSVPEASCRHVRRQNALASVR